MAQTERTGKAVELTPSLGIRSDFIEEPSCEFNAPTPTPTDLAAWLLLQTKLLASGLLWDLLCVASRSGSICWGARLIVRSAT
mmetsp:Transcript_43499/g.94715  ORF Transcript_43499/g.94715 Transcript_43499/m.94715 type:complete len:83 (+) Transcript_43499:602-850(+)